MLNLHSWCSPIVFSFGTDWSTYKHMHELNLQIMLHWLYMVLLFIVIFLKVAAHRALLYTPWNKERGIVLDPWDLIWSLTLLQLSRTKESVSESQQEAFVRNKVWGSWKPVSTLGFSVIGRDEGINSCCMKSRGSFICLSLMFLAERKLDRKPSELFNLPCIHHLQAGHHSFL